MNAYADPKVTLAKVDYYGDDAIPSVDVITTPVTDGVNAHIVVMQHVQSSNIAKVGWHDGWLYVEFLNGGRYRYGPELPVATFHAMLEAESVGKFLNVAIKKAYGYENLK